MKPVSDEVREITGIKPKSFNELLALRPWWGINEISMWRGDFTLIINEKGISINRSYKSQLNYDAVNSAYTHFIKSEGLDRIENIYLDYNNLEYSGYGFSNTSKPSILKILEWIDKNYPIPMPTIEIGQSWYVRLINEYKKIPDGIKFGLNLNQGILVVNSPAIVYSPAMARLDDEQIRFFTINNILIRKKNGNIFREVMLDGNYVPFEQIYQMIKTSSEAFMIKNNEILWSKA